MQPQFQTFARGPQPGSRTDLAPGVERFMTGVFGWMGAGLAVTAAIAWAMSEAYASNPALLQTLFGTPLKWVIMFGPLAFAWFFTSRIQKMDPQVAMGMFLVYAGLLGVGLSVIPLIYTAASIFGIFFVTSIMFSALAAFGYFTKKDLSPMGRFLFMAMIGLMAAWVVSLFVPGVYFWVAAIGVLIFAALTAYDTQKLKQMYLMHGGGGNLAILGAFQLYLDFLNMFLFLLHLFGDRK